MTVGLGGRAEEDDDDLAPPPSSSPLRPAPHLPQEKDESNNKTYFVTLTSPRPGRYCYTKRTIDILELVEQIYDDAES